MQVAAPKKLIIITEWANRNVEAKNENKNPKSLRLSDVFKPIDTTNGW